MGNLSNLYISQSFISLIHLGTNEAATSTPTQLEDGLGNGIGIYVNTAGELSASVYSGSVAGIGNVSAFSSSVSSRINAITASVPAGTVSSSAQITALGFATTSSVNTLSASVYTLSASVDSRLDSLENFSGSQYKTDSASFDSRIIAAVTGTGFVTTGSFNAYTASQAVSNSLFIQSSQTSSMAVSSSTYAVTASYAVNAQTASEARNLVIIARNGNQSTLAAGTVVRITSAVGDNPIFNTASFDNEALSSNTLGILRNTLASGADGEVVVNGIVLGVNTDPALGYVAGDVLYLSSSGQFTRVQPQAPLQTVTLGEVLRAQQNNGSIYVNVSNGWELQELHNVQINTPLTNDLLAYESSSYGLWKNKTYSQLGLSTTSSVDTLSSSIFQTDATQSYQITANALTASNLVTSLSQSLWFTDTTQSANISSNSASLATLSASFIAVSASALTHATTGSNTFIGTETISGSLKVTGSVAGNVVALSVASNTASIDLSTGTFFTLTIPSSSITFITATNITPGITANIVLTQQSTTGSIAWSSEFKFPSGSINTGSAVASAVDLVSVMSVGTTTLYSVGAKQLQ